MFRAQSNPFDDVVGKLPCYEEERMCAYVC